MTCEQLQDENVRWSNLYAAPLASHIQPHRNMPDPNKRLKIGYLSPDFRHHAIMRLLPGVFEFHDKDNFEIFAYSINTQPDIATDLVKARVHHFIELTSSKNEIANRVHADGIDILVDLGSHTMPVDALLAFALKPAPIQLTWMGVLATSGMSTIDYFIGDKYMPGPGTDNLFTEKVYRLPRMHACYRPLESLETAPSPYFQNGYITFGSFNNPNKINRDVVKVWSVILHLHPTSRLLLKYLDLDLEIAQRRLRQWFTEDGIPSDRLQFEGAEPPQRFLQALNRVDIALDPYPYNGGTTTLDTLWMGVPVVSRAGRLAVARGGACLLDPLGLPVANTWEQYIAIAASMVNAIPHQPEARHRLRENMKNSVLMDELGMARTMEAAYRDMWRTWCAGQSASSRVES
jgi:predicted O-linked N-acetylglucosamine transferase (SPINDLY family)